MVATSGTDSPSAGASLEGYRRSVRGAVGAWSPALRALWIFLWSRLALWALAAATVLLFEEELNPSRGRWDSPRLHELGAAVDVWARWDSDWYLRIAESGYDWPSSTPAFFPLYPTLVAGVGRLLGDRFLLAGLAVSLVACATAFVLLHGLVRRGLGAEDASRAVLYLALFPTSLFLGAVYGESVFLALAIGTFVLAERGRQGWASATAGLALLTRAQGVALLPALAVFAWRSDRRGRGLALLVLPVAMFLAFPLTLEITVGHAFAFLDAQKVWERSLAPLGPLGGLVLAIGEGDVLGPVLAVALLGLALLAWRRLGAAYGLYAVVALALPMALPSERLGGLYSFPRLALAAFPCLVALAVLGRDRRVHLAAVAVLGAALAINVVRWALWYWVS
jgi:Mannosyltransferase (PIG-V)